MKKKKQDFDWDLESTASVPSPRQEKMGVRISQSKCGFGWDLESSLSKLNPWKGKATTQKPNPKQKKPSFHFDSDTLFNFGYVVFIIAMIAVGFMQPGNSRPHDRGSGQSSEPFRERMEMEKMPQNKFWLQKETPSPRETSSYPNPTSNKLALEPNHFQEQLDPNDILSLEYWENRNHSKPK